MAQPTSEDNSIEKFDDTFGCANRVRDNDRIFERTSRTSEACALGRNLYSEGVHRIRMKCEGEWAFFGILPHNIKPIAPKKTYPNFVKTPSLHGWETGGLVNKNAEYQDKKKSFWKNSHQKNDIYSLVIDCENMRLTIENERTGEHHEIWVNLNDTPQPWRLFVMVIYIYDKVRLL